MPRTNRSRRPSAPQPQLVQEKLVQPQLVQQKPAPKKRPRQPKQTSPSSASLHDLNTKRRGELAELAFTLKATSLGFAVSKPYGDSERYDFIVDARPLLSHACDRAKVREGPAPELPTQANCPIFRDAGSVNKIGIVNARRLRECPLLHPHESSPTAPLWRVQVKSSTQLMQGLYHVNAHRRTLGRAVPYRLGEIDFLAAFIIPEDTWYILPLAAFLGSTSLLFRRRHDPKPGLYDEYKEAWHLLRPNQNAAVRQNG